MPLPTPLMVPALLLEGTIERDRRVARTQVARDATALLAKEAIDRLNGKYHGRSVVRRRADHRVGRTFGRSVLLIQDH